ncbi:bifunctional DNA primase/polymerase [Gordonia aichiensis]
MSRNAARGPSAPTDPAASGEQENARLDGTSSVGHFASAPTNPESLAIDLDPEITAHTLVDFDGALPLQVLPIVPDGKTPLIRNGFHAATDDHGEISRWFRRWPDANLAVAVPRGNLVIDVDLDKAVAARTITDLESQYGPLPATRTVRTPKGGLHYYYAVDPSIRFRGIAGPGVDLRAGGRHYVLVPPSRIGTARYEYLDSDEWTPVADLPLSWVAGLEYRRPVLNTTRRRVLPAALTGIGDVQLGTVTLDDLGDFLDALPPGKMDTLMSRAVEPNTLAESMRKAAHDTLTRVSYRVIALAAEGHPGGRHASQLVIVAFVREMERRMRAGEPARDPDEIMSEIVRAVAGAVIKVAAE